jgi:hypothetical protein
MDTLMRGINKWLWPYMVIVVCNELNFLGSDANEDAQRRDKWVTGSVTNDMITPRGRGQKTKPKFADDHTVLTGPSVQHNMPLSQLPQPNGF